MEEQTKNTYHRTFTYFQEAYNNSGDTQ